MKKLIAILCLLSKISTVHAASILILPLGYECQPSKSDATCLDAADKIQDEKMINKVKAVKLLNNVQYTSSFGQHLVASPAIIASYDNGSIILTDVSAKRLGISMSDLFNELKSDDAKIVIRHLEDNGQSGVVLSIEKRF